MPDKTPAEKLRIKPGMTACLLHVPDGVHERLALPNGVTLVDEPGGADFVLDFATRQDEAEERLLALKPSIGPKTIVWMGYPKGSKAAGYDISRDTIWRFASEIGLVLNANVAIDEVWSAVRMRPA